MVSNRKILIDLLLLLTLSLPSIQWPTTLPASQHLSQATESPSNFTDNSTSTNELSASARTSTRQSRITAHSNDPPPLEGTTNVITKTTSTLLSTSPQPSIVITKSSTLPPSTTSYGKQETQYDHHPNINDSSTSSATPRSKKILPTPEEKQEQETRSIINTPPSNIGDDMKIPLSPSTTTMAYKHSPLEDPTRTILEVADDRPKESQSKEELIKEEKIRPVASHSSGIMQLASNLQDGLGVESPMLVSDDAYYSSLLIDRHCAADMDSGVRWKDTEGGTLAVKPCPTSYQGNSYRPCYTNGLWGPIDYSECRIVRLTKLRHLVFFHLHKNFLNGLHHLAEELDYLLSTTEIRSPLDRLEAMDVLSGMVRAPVNLDLDTEKDRAYIRILLRIADDLLIQKKIFFPTDSERNKLLTAKSVELLNGLIVLAENIQQYRRESESGDFIFSESPNVGLFLFRRPPQKEIILNVGVQNITIRIFNEDVNANSQNPDILLGVVLIHRLQKLLDTDSETLNSDLVLLSHLHFQNENWTFSVNKSEIQLGLYQFLDDNLHNHVCSQIGSSPDIWGSQKCKLTKKDFAFASCTCSNVKAMGVIMKTQANNSKIVPVRTINIPITVSGVLTLCAYLLTFISHLHTFRKERTESSIILLNLLVSITAIQIMFLSGTNITSNQELCYSISLTLHYMFLVASFWLLSHDIHLYRKLQQSATVEKTRRIRQYCLLSWVVPILLVLMSFILNPTGYESKKYCWLSIQRGMLLSFVVPVTVLFLINTILMVLVLKKFFEQRPFTHKTEIEKIRRSLRIGVMLLPYFSVNWFLSVLALEEMSTPIFQHIFALSNGLQGVIVFLLYSDGSGRMKTGLSLDSFRKRGDERPIIPRSQIYYK